jgi:hypothetical protein
MKRFVIVAASILGVSGIATAADLPVRQPAPPPTAGVPLIGKAPIGKGPIGKGPVGKFPVGKAPAYAPPAPGPVVTRG